MAIEKDFFRQVMGRFTTGVTVVTMRNNEELAGLTVNAFASVSLNPPLILICVDNNSQTIVTLRKSQAFAVNMLTEEQKQLSRCFATNNQERYDYFCHASFHTAATGAPIIDGSLAFIDARVVTEYPGGDHTIFLGQVEAMGTAGHAVFAKETKEGQRMLLEVGTNGNGAKDEARPLAYYQGQYRHLVEEYKEPSLGTVSLASSNGKDIEETSRGR